MTSNSHGLVEWCQQANALIDVPVGLTPTRTITDGLSTEGLYNLAISSDPGHPHPIAMRKEHPSEDHLSLFCNATLGYFSAQGAGDATEDGSKTKCRAKKGNTSVYTRPSAPQFPVPHTPLYSSASCGIPNSFNLCVRAWFA
jgi:hypothetical protein